MSDTQNLVLVINCGSSSLKFAVFAGSSQDPELSGLAECLGSPESRLKYRIHDGENQTVALAGPGHDAALASILGILGEQGLLGRVTAVGHRIVHGGERFCASVVITPEVMADIEACTPLAPLHNPANILGVRTAMEALPDVAHVAVFDTAFHQTMPETAFSYAVPERFYRQHGVRRYGFHGTSHRFVSAQTINMLGLNPDDHGIVIAHLGNGASASAILNGRSVDTSMGMTPLEGLVMGTRCGDIDVGAVLHVARCEGLDLDGIDRVLNRESGLLGLSGLSNDCRTLEQAAAEGHVGARLALAVFVHRLARSIGALATSLPRLDAIVFTGGIGENSSLIRRDTVARLGVFGLTLDAAANEAAVRGRAGIISAGNRPVVAVVATNEEWMIASDALALVQSSSGTA